MRETIIPSTFTSALSTGLEAISDGITQILKEPILVGVVGVGLAFFVMKKAFRMIKSR